MGVKPLEKPHWPGKIDGDRVSAGCRSVLTANAVCLEWFCRKIGFTLEKTPLSPEDLRRASPTTRRCTLLNDSSGATAELSVTRHHQPSFISVLKSRSLDGKALFSGYRAFDAMRESCCSMTNTSELRTAPRGARSARLLDTLPPFD